MINRRSFLLGAGTLAMSQLLASCGSSQNPALRVKLLKNSIPAQLLNEFRQSLKQSATLDFTPETQLKELFTRLETWHKPNETGKGWMRIPFITKTPVIADLVTLGDYWLAQAIEQKLIQPIEPTQTAGWKQLPRPWQELVRRNAQGQLDASGKIWGAPYRWGSTVIVYRRDKFKALGWEPRDWQDLWREELRDRISVLDQAREVIGLTLKRLGHSYNTENLDKVPDLKDALAKLKGQIKLYSSDTYLEPLLIGDTWLAVGWSTDVLPVLKSDRNIAAVVPQSGTALWADVWVRPAAAKSEDTANMASLQNQWIDFCWQQKQALEISLFTRAASPIIAGMNRSELPKSLQTNSVLLPDTQVLEKSEFLYPLSQSTALKYLSLWQEIR